MLRAWIVYGLADIEKNAFSIEHFKAELKKHDIESELIVFENLEFAEQNCSTAQGSESESASVDIDEISVAAGPAEVIYNGKNVQPPDIVINRTRSYEFAKWLEENVRFSFNSSRIVLLGNDKVEALRFVEQLGFRIMPVFTEIEAVTAWPIVAKTRSGHGGSEVFLVRNHAEALKLQEEYGDLFFQEYSEQGNCDMRVYVVGGEILCAIKRSSQKDFRSNFSLGGTVEAVTVPREVCAEIGVMVRELGEVGYCGFDFIINRDEWVFNELEDMVGARSVYTYTEFDPIAEYVNYIGRIVANE